MMNLNVRPVCLEGQWTCEEDTCQRNRMCTEGEVRPAGDRCNRCMCVDNRWECTTRVTDVCREEQQQQSTAVITACARTVTGSVQTEAASNRMRRRSTANCRRWMQSVYVRRKWECTTGPARHRSVRKAISTR